MLHPESPTEILLIQKLIGLLDDGHYKAFINHLNENNAVLPIKLCDSIRNALPSFHSHEELCKLVYGSYQQSYRQSFNQLCAHTFRLSGFLSIHYPAYLFCNINKIQHFINEGKKKEANFLADMLLELAEKIEDFQTQIACLKFMTQQSFLYKDTTAGLKLNSRLFTAIENETTLNQLLHITRSVFNVTLRHKFEGVIEEKRQFVQLLQRHERTSIRLLAQYAQVYEMYYNNPADFVSDKTRSLIEDIERELHNNSFVVFPFLFDLKSSIGFLKLNSNLHDIGSKEGNKQLSDLSRHYTGVKYWSYYLNIPDLFVTTIRTSHFLSLYFYHIHRHDYPRQVPVAALREVEELRLKCESLMNERIWDRRYTSDLITIKMLHGALQVLRGGKHIKQGVDELESLLVEYQQINISSSIDSIFIVLMIGYFAAKNYNRCNDTYKRYIKIIRNKPVYDDNDIDIHTYYYLSQWLSNGRQQYVVKLERLYEKSLSSEAYTKSKKGLEELTKFFNVPVSFSS
ncbi:MAG: hypothetical protein JNK66_10165 [Chitinophagales bacterium]|nr:hypothetical protein [Chitinophagales bacterium]